MEANAKTTKRRVNKITEETDWDFEIIEDWDEHPDTLQPDDFNFCDWVSAGEEPFKVADKVSKLQAKIKNGVLVVALQKNQGSLYPVWGQQTVSKASLYLSLDRAEEDDNLFNTMKIGKAKAFDDINPNDFIAKYKMIDGINLMQKGIWEPESDGKYRALDLTKD